MEENMELITVKEYAKAAGVTEQAVYKRLRAPKSDLQQFVVEQNGKKYIKAEALESIVPKQTAVKTETDMLKDMVELLKEQLSVKDEQISSLQKQNEQLTEALQNTTNSLQAAQALHAGTIQKQLTEASESSDQTEEHEVTAPAPEQTETKKGFFRRLSTLFNG